MSEKFKKIIILTREKREKNKKYGSSKTGNRSIRKD